MHSSPSDITGLRDLDFCESGWRWMNRPVFWHVCVRHRVQISPWCLLNWLMEVSLSQYGSWCLRTSRALREGWWWKADQQEMREDRKMKMKEGKWDGERESRWGKGERDKSRGLWQERKREREENRQVEQKQFRRNEESREWFMRYIYLVNGVFSPLLPGWKYTPQFSHTLCRHLPLLSFLLHIHHSHIPDNLHTSGCNNLYFPIRLIYGVSQRDSNIRIFLKQTITWKNSSLKSFIQYWYYTVH